MGSGFLMMKGILQQNGSFFMNNLVQPLLREQA